MCHLVIATKLQVFDKVVQSDDENNSGIFLYRKERSSRVKEPGANWLGGTNDLMNFLQ